MNKEIYKNFEYLDKKYYELATQIEILKRRIIKLEIIGEFCENLGECFIWIKFSNKDIQEKIGEYIKIKGQWNKKKDVIFYVSKIGLRGKKKIIIERIKKEK